MPSPIDRLALHFAGEQTRPGLLARAALRRPAPGDAELARRLAARAAEDMRPDGSVGGAALPTIWRVHELLDLATPAGAEPTGRALRWVLGLQGKPGAYGEGCDRERHGRRLCEHYLVGFFAAGTSTERLAPITLPNGKVYRAEPAARFAISCLAVRAVLRAGGGDRQTLDRHLDVLVALAEQWTAWGGHFAPDLIVATLHLLALAGPERREVVDRLVELAAASQAADGGWPNADLFHVLDALRAAGTDRALAGVRRAVPA
ncbi:MAG TPA: hypothetical protein VMN37_01515, partial [Gemmatimonadales bacterium]|nr:hypothetical protein [Gemmatimonadales bacterium]